MEMSYSYEQLFVKPNYLSWQAQKYSNRHLSFDLFYRRLLRATHIASPPVPTEQYSEFMGSIRPTIMAAAASRE
ncbi:hypothetical protein FOC1_g10004495 [Fusarium oxysporum f. sp. cubense race 1]|uniref:Uncharacterized protein n=1 Tax=Fusarium oxysporum f. sp. cubense (strain race 1) TaxID=1229664 RepID=N4U8T5_FUSC1|nr:hypothetical protein FOC1_g10004495 [Fusarium oxysporum f. sp. cubense race 1]